MENKLFVGGLPYATTEEEIRSAFGDAGSVISASILKEKETGRSRGFGFVEMSSAEDAQKAIEMFDGKDFQGRKLTVNVARPREDRPQNGGRFDNRGPRQWN